MGKELQTIKPLINGYYAVNNKDGCLATFKHLQHAVFFVIKYQELFSKVEDNICHDCMEEPIYADQLCKDCYFK